MELEFGDWYLREFGVPGGEGSWWWAEPSVHDYSFWAALSDLWFPLMRVIGLSLVFTVDLVRVIPYLLQHIL